VSPNERTLPPEHFDTSIDTVRFLAFLLVFLAHVSDTVLQRALRSPGSAWAHLVSTSSAFGRQGVTIFFTLTGFLLARVLLREKARNGDISIKNFYLRRILRIWPLYFFYLLTCAFLSLFSTNPTIHWIEVPLLLTFTYNIGQTFLILPSSFATITWSLSVEEQIYLVFPWVMKRLGAKNFNYWLLATALLGIFSRVLINAFNISKIPNTFEYLDVIILGIVFALHEDGIRRFFSCHILPYSLGAFVLIATYVGNYTGIMSSTLGRILSLNATALLAIVLLLVTRELAQHDRTQIFSFFGYLGRRSYGMYLFHWMVINIMFGKNIFFSDSKGFNVFGVIFALLGTIGVSILSYRYFEQPFLTLRRRFQAVA
jgi:peptidoglycan/LPS O-acetylase OafA/YrhL